MSPADVHLMSKYLKYAETNAWLQTRQMMLSTLKPYLKKKDLTADQLFPLPIDDDIKRDNGMTTEVTNAEIEMYHRMKTRFEKKEEAN